MWSAARRASAQIDEVAGGLEIPVCRFRDWFPEGEEPKILLGTGSPAKVIREAVVHQGPDLLVIGMISSGGVPGLQVGSTTERVLDRIECSILAIKPADFVCPGMG